MGDQQVAKPLLTHKTTQTQNKRTQTSALKILPVRNKSDAHRQDWINRWDRLTDERVPNEFLQHKSNGRRN
jgi:hypothetical protein